MRCPARMNHAHTSAAGARCRPRSPRARLSGCRWLRLTDVPLAVPACELCGGPRSEGVAPACLMHSEGRSACEEALE